MKESIMIKYTEMQPSHQHLSRDLEADCLQNMAANGLEYSGQLIADGKIRRYSTDNQKNKCDEWYVAYEGVSSYGNQYLICTYGSWSQDVKHVFKSYEHDKSLINVEERKEFYATWKSKRENIQAALKEEHEKIAQEACEKWEKSFLDIPTQEYLRYTKAKKVFPMNVRFGLNPQGFPSIIIPLRNYDGQIRSLQFISMDEHGKSYKTFLSGGEKRGNFHTLGEISDGDEPIFIAEGYATGLSVYEAGDGATVIAFDAGNLGNVVENLKKKFPNNPIIIAGDNDQVGKEKAYAVARRFGCKVVFPEFPKEKSVDAAGKPYTDFNDLQQVVGAEEVKKQLKQSWSVPTIQDELKKAAYNLLKKEDPCGNFCISGLPKLLSNYISSISETTNAHPIMIACSVLTTISAFLKRKVFIEEGAYFQKLYPNFWLLCITKSGQFKSTALNKGARLAWKKNDEVIGEIKKYEANLRMTVEDEEKRKIKEEILKVSRDNVLLPNKITAEALLEYLSDGHYGVILASEFGGWLQNLDKNHNGDLKAIFTELYDVPNSFRYKTRTQGDFVLSNPYFSICGVSTLAWLKPSLKGTDVASGFFARFLIFAPPHQDIIPPALPTHKIAANFYAEQVVWDILEGIDEPYSYTLSGQAKLLFESLHEDIYKFHKSYDEKSQELLEPYVKRWSPYLLKLAMIMRLFEDQKSREISESALLAALTVLLPAMQSTVLLFEGELGESEYQRKCRVLFEWICKRIGTTGAPVLRKAIFQSKKLNDGPTEYDHVLNTLIESGKIKLVTEGRKKNDWEYSLEEQSVDEVERR